mmetsp:Transcript_28960/g.67062  ORF Transcript_28960/g.67062 Transcript_28960/m.67062 type:complete len:219 (-) Transcript_28960:321-977(-)
MRRASGVPSTKSRRYRSAISVNTRVKPRHVSTSSSWSAFSYRAFNSGTLPVKTRTMGMWCCAFSERRASSHATSQALSKSSPSLSASPREQTTMGLATISSGFASINRIQRAKHFRTELRCRECPEVWGNQWCRYCITQTLAWIIFWSRRTRSAGSPMESSAFSARTERTCNKAGSSSIDEPKLVTRSFTLSRHSSICRASSATPRHIWVWMLLGLSL